MRKGSFTLGTLCIVFSIGVLLAALSPAWWRSSPMLALLLAATPVALWAARTRRALLPPAVLLAGIAWFGCQALEVRATRLAPALEHKHFVVEGVVSGVPRRDRLKTRLRLRPQRLWHAGRALPLPSYLLLSDYNPGAHYREGETWRLLLRLRGPRGMRNAAGPDYERWLFSERIGATGYVVHTAANHRLAASGRLPSAWGARWRERVRAGIREALPGAPLAAIVEALAVGVRGGISEEQWALLRATGAAHLVAISGLHIGMAAAFGCLLAAGLWRLAALGGCSGGGGGRRLLLVVAGLGVALFYALLAGFSLPTRRALLMLAVFSAARCLARRTALLHALAVALAAVLLLDPLAVLGAAFWLSFVAVASIALVLSPPAPALASAPPSPPQERSAAGRALHGCGRVLRSACRVQLALLVALPPALIVFFQQAPLAASLVNLVLTPLYAVLVVPPVLVAALLLIVDISAPAAWLLVAAERCIALGWWLMEQAAALAPLSLQLPRPGSWLLLAAAAGLALCLGARRLPGMPLALVLVVPLLLAAPPRLPPGAVRLTVLDVGQGLAVLVQTRGHSLLYDTGARYPSGFDLGQRVVTPNLRHLGVSRLDALVVSHGDVDHAGGYGAVRTALRPRRILGGEAERLGGEAEPCRAGQSWRWDGVRFTMLWPAPGARHPNNNNRSCVLRVDGAHGRILLTGDIESAVEERLVRTAPAALRATVLVAPHHGSATSSGAALLAAVAPRVTIISAGYKNRYDHPDPAVLARYRRHRSRVWNTAHEGALTVRLAPGGVVVQSRRAMQPGLW